MQIRSPQLLRLAVEALNLMKEAVTCNLFIYLFINVVQISIIATIVNLERKFQSASTNRFHKVGV